ncbi:MAG: tRNA pseudouridine(38-40) synthase TruA [Prevotellaceae bacterium]|jgi:tRNA pseudouridine38-40 synthase|nr:tRNA pseudouridine(38-40) synthase TruA [Prevotellaceae bacterium]
MFRYFLQLSYDGSEFHGWQVQHNANTVQAALDKALTTYLHEHVETVGAGRTDTGVHASFFVAHFDCSDSDLEKNQTTHLYKLNSILPKSISLQKIKKMHADANARFDAVSRTYCYYMHQTKNPFLQKYSAPLNANINMDLMNEAAKKLLDYTDFTSFSKLHTDVKTNNCNIAEAFWYKQNEQLIFKITANRFLRNMVRAIVGTLLEVGRNRITVSDFCKIIEQKNRCLAGKSVAAKGLFLVDIKYPYQIND